MKYLLSIIIFFFTFDLCKAQFICGNVEPLVRASNSSSVRQTPGEIIIPVMFHEVYGNKQNNIFYSKLIDLINDYYTFTNGPNNSSTYNTKIRFEIAQINQDGDCFSGVHNYPMVLAIPLLAKLK